MTDQPRVFISYQRADEPFARQVREHLIAAGVQTWMDQYDIPVGAYWPDEIDKGLAESHIVIGILSPDSVESRNVKNEWDWAIQNEKRLVLVQVKPCVIPHRYVSINFIDAVHDPDRALQQLASTLAADVSVASRRENDVPAPAQASAPHGLFVGRDREVREAFNVLATALAGQRRLLLIAGEPGIGKTRLAVEITDEAVRRGARMCWGRCHEWEGSPAFWPWIEILRGCLRSSGRAELERQLGSDVRMIAQLVPELATAAADPPASFVLNSEQARFRLFDAIARVLEYTARQQPLVAVIDDLHWADEPSLRLLEFITRELQQTRLLLIGTYRDVEVRRDHPLARSLASLARSAEPRRISLKGIARESVDEFIRASTDVEPSPRLVEAVYDSTEGNPFFVAEVVTLLESEGRLEMVPDSDGWDLAIPESVRDVIGRRLDQLSTACNDVLKWGAVIGREFTIDVLAQARGTAPVAELDLLDVALAARVVEETNTFGRYRFSHALIQQTLYEELTASQRVRLHGQLGRAVEQIHAANLAPFYGELAYHFARSPMGDHLEKAVNYTVLAGHQAVNQLAWESAVKHFSQAVDLLDSQPSVDAELLCNLLLDLGDAENRSAAGRPRDSSTIGLGAGGSEEARSTFWRAADVARAADLPVLLARAALGVVGFNPHAQQGGEAALNLLDEALRRLPPDDTALRARVIARSSIDRYMSVFAGGESPLSADIEAFIRSSSEESIAIARRVGDPATLAYVLAMSGLQMMLRLPHERLALASEAIDQATISGDLEALCWGLFVKQHAARDAGDMAMVRATLDEWHQAADQLRLPYFRWALATHEVGAALREGRLDDAKRWIEHADAIQPMSGAATVQLIWLRREQGMQDALMPLINRFGPAYMSNALFLKGLLEVCLIETGQVDRASQGLDRLAEDSFRDRRLYLRNLSWIAEVCTALADVERARLLYQRLLPDADRNVGGSSTDYTGGSVSYYLGLLATTMGDWDTADKHFIVALDKNRAWGILPYVGYTQLGWATMLAGRNAAGDRYHALDLLDGATALARDIGMARLTMKATELRMRLLAKPAG